MDWNDDASIVTTVTQRAARHEAAQASVNTSNYVYIRSEEYAWIPGRVLETNATTALVSLPQYRDEQQIASDGGRSAQRYEKVSIALADYPNQALPLQNVDEEGKLREVEDMVDLPFLHEVCGSDTL
jgi:hypothetical protein